MELEFIQNETGKWVAEFQVTSDFNLHLDNVNKRSLKILQKTQGNGYGIVADTLEVRDYTNVYDCDFTGLVYPKFIRIESGEKPYGIITTDGEVTEIKSQSKEVEITANGVTEIAPDAGFGYLSGVKVNVNVPQSGGSGGESEYFRIDWDRLKSEFGYLPAKDYENISAFMSKQASIFSCVTAAHFGVSTMMGRSQITPVAVLLIALIQAPGFVDLSDIKKVAFTTFKGYDAGVGSFVEMTPDYLLSGMYRDCFISITKEEFYNLEA